MFSSRSILALLAAPLLAFAQSNPFKIPTTGLSATAGQTLDLSWTATTSGTISLVLRSGASSDLNEGTIIASNIANSGSYSWAVPSSTPFGSDYTVEIVDDTDTSETNYTPYFVIDSTVTTSPTSALSSVSLGAATTSLSLSTASATGSASTVTASSSGSSAATGSSSSSAAAASTTGSSTMTTATSSSSGSASSDAASSTSSSGATFQSTSSAAASSASTTASSGAQSNFHIGGTVALMGAVAMGALAL